VATPRRAFLTALAGTASNPATIISWAAIFAAAGTAAVIHAPADSFLLVAGAGIGSLTWVSVLATGTAAAGRAIGKRAIALADAIAGLGMLGFAGAVGYGALRDR
jgi:putative LysE/RhtB family amino acid efflux pump